MAHHCSTAGQSLPTARSHFRAVYSDSILSLTADFLLAKVLHSPALQPTVSCGPLSPSPPVPQPLGSGVRCAERWRKW